MLAQGVQTLAYVAVLVTCLPLLLRFALSPITLILLSPLLLILGLLVLVCFGVIAAVFSEWLRPQKSKPNNLRDASRTLTFATPAAWQANLTRIQWSAQEVLPPIKECSPETSALAHEILNLIVRDFVLVWYSRLSDSPAFPNALRRTVHESLQNVLTRATQIDISTLVVRRVLPKITAHVEKFRQSEEALRGAALERRLSDSEELDILLASRYVGKGKLHPAVANLSSLATRPTEDLYLRNLFDKILPLVLPRAEAESGSVRIVAREIIGCAVLRPIIDMFTDPDFWNQAIDRVASAAIREQKLVTKIRHMLENQLPKSSPSSRTTSALPSNLKGSRGSKTEDINSRTDPKRFAIFLHSISRCESLLDARRLKNDIMSEIRRTRDLLAQHASDDWINGERTEDIVAYLDRLYNAKNKAEKRIDALSGSKMTGPRSPSSLSTPLPLATSNKLTLRDVLRDSSSLLYFMEFMERRSHRTLLVQFWLAVDAFKDPLAQLDSDSDASDDEQAGPRDATSTAQLIEDTTMLFEVYFAQPSRAAELGCISAKHIATLTAFVHSEFPPTKIDESRVRRSVMHAQNQVEKAMEEDFEAFAKSELWHRAVGDMSPSVQRPPASPSTLLEEPDTPISEPAPKRGDDPALIHASQSVPVVPRRPIRRREGSMASNDSGRHLSSFDVLMGSTDDIDGSRAPLFEDVVIERRKIDALQAALTDIIADDSATHDEKPPHTPSQKSLTPSFQSSSQKDSQLPRLRHKVFDDSDHEELPLDQTNVPDEDEGIIPPVQVALPGDLQLAHDVARLSEKIRSLQVQETMLEALMRKAELTGDAQELRLLSRSRNSLVREIRGLTFQRAHYETQEAANRLIPERTRVSIVDSAVGDEDGRSVVRYLVEIQQLASDGSFASGWGVARRYSEFYQMHTRLKERYAAVRALEFPGKRLVTSLSNNFVDSRRSALEKYLQNLVLVSSVCESDELRSFLSRQVAAPAATAPADPAQGSIVRTVYRSVADSIDDMFFGPSMLDVTLQRLSRQAAEIAGMTGSSIQDEDAIARALGSKAARPEETLAKLQGDLKPLDGETGASSFSAPICDLLLAVFELDRKNNWLRRQAVVTILQQLLGSTIERKVRDTVRTYLAESQLLGYITVFRDTLWPGGKLKPTSVLRTDDEKMQTREQAHSKLSAIIPDLAANMIGRSNARRGARRMFAVMQNRRLNQHIVYSVIDEVLEALFPEIQGTTGI
ncbi:Intermediate filament protein [Ceratobasidium sp. 428]|nr:Intermediate filament protein [Ceratobasidium sp. 428]